jgi:hypothetical protein
MNYSINLDGEAPSKAELDVARDAEWLARTRKRRTYIRKLTVMFAVSMVLVLVGVLLLLTTHIGVHPFEPSTVVPGLMVAIACVGVVCSGGLSGIDAISCWNYGPTMDEDRMDYPLEFDNVSLHQAKEILEWRRSDDVMAAYLARVVASGREPVCLEYECFAARIKDQEAAAADESIRGEREEIMRELRMPSACSGVP